MKKLVLILVVCLILTACGNQPLDSSKASVDIEVLRRNLYDAAGVIREKTIEGMTLEEAEVFKQDSLLSAEVMKQTVDNFKYLYLEQDDSEYMPIGADTYSIDGTDYYTITYADVQLIILKNGSNYSWDYEYIGGLTYVNNEEYQQSLKQYASYEDVLAEYDSPAYTTLKVGDQDVLFVATNVNPHGDELTSTDYTVYSTVGDSVRQVIKYGQSYENYPIKYKDGFIWQANDNWVMQDTATEDGILTLNVVYKTVDENNNTRYQGFTLNDTREDFDTDSSELFDKLMAEYNNAVELVVIYE